MSLLENPVTTFEKESSANFTGNANKTLAKDELTLTTKSVVNQVNAMPESMKQKKQLSSDSLENILHKIVEEKGEENSIRIRKTSAKELEIEGLSKIALHSFILKAEELGKNIKYTRTLKVEITD